MSGKSDRPKDFTHEGGFSLAVPGTRMCCPAEYKAGLTFLRECIALNLAMSRQYMLFAAGVGCSCKGGLASYDAPWTPAHAWHD